MRRFAWCLMSGLLGAGPPFGGELTAAARSGPSASCYDPAPGIVHDRAPRRKRSAPAAGRDRLRSSAGILLLGMALLLAGAAPCAGQQPFLTDDAEVTDAGHWHIQYSNEYDVLQKSAYPNLRQDWQNFVFQYGLAHHVEVNVDFPLILIENAGRVPNAFGFGDIDFAAKWKYVEETPGSKWPALTVNGAVELPTGNEQKQLGSGLADYGVNFILQKTLAPVTQLHVNAGVQFAGNTQTGVVGIHTPGHILSSGVSVTRDVSTVLHLGIDLNGAEIHDGGPKERQLQLTVGGNYSFTADDTFDFSVFAGWQGAPRVGFLVGLSITP